MSIAITILGFLFALQGVAWLVAPERAAAGLDMPRGCRAQHAGRRPGRILPGRRRHHGARRAALAARGYVERDWSSDPWTRGCYAGFMPPGVLSDYGPALREPIGRIHWAGTETAEVWNGYIGGAVRSGERAADEVVAA